MKNIIFASKSYDRKGKIHESIEHHNRDVADHFRREKFDKMKENPYSFFRGSNHIFWSDFAGDWQINRFGGSAFSRTWIEGDSHVYNMGAYLNNAGHVAFGFDDYDDALVADYQYDIWRFCTSMVLDAWQNERFGDQELTEAIQIFAKTYLKTITSFDRVDLFSASFNQGNTCKPLSKFLAKTSKKYSRERMLGKWTEVSDGNVRKFRVIEGKLSPVDTETRKKIVQAFQGYLSTIPKEFAVVSDLHNKILDVAERRGAGTGSLGLKRYYVLIAGNTEHVYDDLILDVKQQKHPTAFTYLSDEEVKEYEYNFENHAHRHAEACKDLAEHPDQHLGWLSLDGDCFSVRERSPFKNDFPTETLEKTKNYYRMASQWAEIMATKHLRAARRLNHSVDQYVFEATINRIARDRKEEFAIFTARIAKSYAKQVRKDWLYFCEGF